jgi:hypothetical protein
MWEIECLIETPSEIEESLDAQKRESFPLLLSGEAWDWHFVLLETTSLGKIWEQLTTPNSSQYDVSSRWG